MKIIKGEVKCIDLKPSRVKKGPFPLGTQFSFLVQYAFQPNKMNVVGWEAYRLQLEIARDTKELRIYFEFPDCFEASKFPSFALASELLDSDGIASALEHQANRFGKLTILDLDDEIEFEAEIGRFSTSHKLERGILTSFLRRT